MFLAESAADEVDENVCQVFFAVFDEEDQKDQKAWISCDGDCGRCTEFKKAHQAQSLCAQVVSSQQLQHYHLHFQHPFFIQYFIVSNFIINS